MNNDKVKGKIFDEKRNYEMKKHIQNKRQRQGHVLIKHSNGNRRFVNTFILITLPYKTQV